MKKITMACLASLMIAFNLNGSDVEVSNNNANLNNVLNTHEAVMAKLIDDVENLKTELKSTEMERARIEEMVKSISSSVAQTTKTGSEEAQTSGKYDEAFREYINQSKEK